MQFHKLVIVTNNKNKCNQNLLEESNPNQKCYYIKTIPTTKAKQSNNYIQNENRVTCVDLLPIVVKQGKIKQ